MKHKILDIQLPAVLPSLQTSVGVQAAHRLFSQCWKHQGHSTEPIAQFLLSLHNLNIAKTSGFDGFDLCRRIDDVAFEDVLTVMHWFRGRHHSGSDDIHDLYEIFGPVGELVMVSLRWRFGWVQTERYGNES